MVARWRGAVVAGVMAMVTVALTAAGCGEPGPRPEQLIAVRLEAGRLVVRTGLCHDERLRAVRVKVFPGSQKLEVHPREGRSAQEALETVDLGGLPPGWTANGQPPGEILADRRYTVEVVRERPLAVTVPGDVLRSLPAGTWAAGGWDWDYKLLTAKEFDKRRKASCPESD
ncbi:hypothetical protein ACFCX4_20305 [Kitasatospora sp. NPDC056327]|uniref:hypothetical protein n=1 Tax=Kitasatospora sp. NPDC056327 TaxID=3345785 RepID=UPI0035E05297